MTNERLTGHRLSRRQFIAGLVVTASGAACKPGELVSSTDKDQQTSLPIIQGPEPTPTTETKPVFDPYKIVRVPGGTVELRSPGKSPMLRLDDKVDGPLPLPFRVANNGGFRITTFNQEYRPGDDGTGRVLDYGVGRNATLIISPAVGVIFDELVTIELIAPCDCSIFESDPTRPETQGSARFEILPAYPNPSTRLEVRVGCTPEGIRIDDQQVRLYNSKAVSPLVKQGQVYATVTVPKTLGIDWSSGSGRNMVRSGPKETFQLEVRRRRDSNPSNPSVSSYVFQDEDGRYYAADGTSAMFGVPPPNGMYTWG